MEVRWEGTPPIERIRAAVSSRLSGVSVVAAHDLTGSNEVLVSAEPPATHDLTGLRKLSTRPCPPLVHDIPFATSK
jgi:hypothetical protein